MSFRAAMATLILLSGCPLAGCAGAPFERDAPVFLVHSGLSFWHISALGNTLVDDHEAIVVIDPYGSSVTLSAPCGDTGYPFQQSRGEFTTSPHYKWTTS